MGSHVTNWNKNTSVKFRTDVCSSCKLGFDIDLKSLSKDDYKFVQNAVKNYDSMKPMILEGDQYRLVSPYEGSHCAINYVSKDKQRAVLFAYDLHPRYKEPQQNVKLQGLDAAKMYIDAAAEAGAASWVFLAQPTKAKVVTTAAAIAIFLNNMASLS